MPLISGQSCRKKLRRRRRRCCRQHSTITFPVSSSVDMAETSPFLNPAMQEMSVEQLTEELRQTEESLQTARSETAACLSGLPAMRSVIRSSADNLRVAQSELGDLEDQVLCREAYLEKIECRLQRLEMPLGVSTLEDEHRAIQILSRTNEWLQRRVDPLEERHLKLVQQLQVSNRSSSRCTEQFNLAVRHQLEVREQQVAHCAKVSEDYADLHAKLRTAYWHRLERYQTDLDALRQIGYAKAYDTSQCRAQARDEELQWRTEKSCLLRDIARLEAHVAEVQTHIGQLETSEEQVERRCNSDELHAHDRRDGGLDFPLSLDDSLRKAMRAEAGLAELRALHTESSRRFAENLDAEVAECAKLEVEARAEGLDVNVGAKLDAATRACLAQATADVAAEPIREARRKCSATSAAHHSPIATVEPSEANATSGQLERALAELQQQQDTLGWQLKIMLGT